MRSSDYILGRIMGIMEASEDLVSQYGDKSENGNLSKVVAYDHIRQILKEREEEYDSQCRY